MMGMTSKFAVIDFETTGLSPQQGDRAIEIGVALFDGDRVIDTYQSLMNPGVPVSYFIEGLTGISQEMVEDSPASSMVMREACEVIGDLPIVAHNASFDRNFYVAELGKIGRSHVEPFLCTMLIGRRLYPDSPNHKLATLAALNGINTEGHHRALADAVMTSKLLCAMRMELLRLYHDQTIDSQFLHDYQKKSKSSVRSCASALV
jgi:DNA polymerase-3 subunit epsilon